MTSRFAILTLHSVVDRVDPYRQDMPVEQFSALCKKVKKYFNVMTVAEAHRRSCEGTLPSRTLCLSFDDGYLNNVTIALPVLQHYQLPATFFITTEAIKAGRMWNDNVMDAIALTTRSSIDVSDLNLGLLNLGSAPQRRQMIQDILTKLKTMGQEERDSWVDIFLSSLAVDKNALPRLMMQFGQLKVLVEAGMEIGAHTLSHPILSQVDDMQARREIEQSKRIIEGWIGGSVDGFAYPNGRSGIDFSQRDCNFVREAEFDYAVTTDWGVVKQGADAFQMPRLSVWDPESWRFLPRLLKTFYFT